MLAGDFNVVPTNADIYNAWLWRLDAVLQPQTRAAYQRLMAQGWIDATRHLHPTTASTRSGSMRMHLAAMRDFEWISCCSVHRSPND